MVILVLISIRYYGYILDINMIYKIGELCGWSCIRKLFSFFTLVF